MPSTLNSEQNEKKPKIYQIKIKGHLGDQWSDWFDGLTVALDEDGNTLLTGPVVDDAALHGLLKKVRDLGMPLISFNQIEPEQEGPDEKKYEEGNLSANL